MDVDPNADSHVKVLERDYESLKYKADRLAYSIARLVMTGVVDTRSFASDELLVYLNIGGSDGPDSVPQWIKEYEKDNPRNKR